MYFEAFALSGRRAKCCLYPGRCPGLGASALSGRVGQNFQGVLLLGAFGASGRAASGAFGPSARKPHAKLE